MFRFEIAVLLSVIGFMSPIAAGAESEPTLGQIEVTVKTSDTAPYPQEMVLLSVRSTLRYGQIALERLEQPALQNFSWIQLGRDRWSKSEVNGVPAIVCERLLALFPIKSGGLTIDPFVHHLTIVNNEADRRELELRSVPVTLNVRAWTGAKGGPDSRDSWWLPVKSLTVTDKWEPEPDQISPGETAHRTVMVEAAGITADRLPPVPKLRSQGVITFSGPTERVTTITPAGPVARVTYRWDVRPATGMPATLQAIHIPWFDSTGRQMRDAIIPARRIAFTTTHDGSEPQRGTFGLLLVILSGASSFVAGLLLLRGADSGSGSYIRRLVRYLGARRELRDLRYAANSGDARAFRSALHALALRDPYRAQRCYAKAAVNSGLALLDRHLFGSASGEAPDVRMLSSAFSGAWSHAQPEQEDQLPTSFD